MPENYISQIASYGKTAEAPYIPFPTQELEGALYKQQKKHDDTLKDLGALGDLLNIKVDPKDYGTLKQKQDYYTGKIYDIADSLTKGQPLKDNISKIYSLRKEIVKDPFLTYAPEHYKQILEDRKEGLKAEAEGTPWNNLANASYQGWQGTIDPSSGEINPYKQAGYAKGVDVRAEIEKLVNNKVESGYKGYSFKNINGRDYIVDSEGKAVTAGELQNIIKEGLPELVAGPTGGELGRRSQYHGLDANRLLNETVNSVINEYTRSTSGQSIKSDDMPEWMAKEQASRIPTHQQTQFSPTTLEALNDVNRLFGDDPSKHFSYGTLKQESFYEPGQVTMYGTTPVMGGYKEPQQDQEKKDWIMNFRKTHPELSIVDGKYQSDEQLVTSYQEALKKFQNQSLLDIVPSNESATAQKENILGSIANRPVWVQGGSSAGNYQTALKELGMSDEEFKQKLSEDKTKLKIQPNGPIPGTSVIDIPDSKGNLQRVYIGSDVETQKAFNFSHKTGQAINEAVSTGKQSNFWMPHANFKNGVVIGVAAPINPKTKEIVPQIGIFEADEEGKPLRFLQYTTLDDIYKSDEGNFSQSSYVGSKLSTTKKSTY